MMREFHFEKVYHSLLSADIVALIGQIHECKGAQNLFIEIKADILTQWVNTARIQSAEASNKMEGIYTSDARLKKIVQDKTVPKTRDEREIAGYRDVLAAIHNSHDFIPPKPAIILQLHRDLYKFNGMSIGGSYKSSDSVTEQKYGNDAKFIEYEPIPAEETPETVSELCDAFEAACKEAELDSLLLIPVFILDFLCIQPFNDGNGRMSHLLTLLLLYRAGYVVGKYISIEKLIEQSKETYDEALQESSVNWREGRNDYVPFVRYMLGIIATAYREFSAQVQLLTPSGLSKSDRVRAVIKNTVGKITKSELVEKCPNVSAVTVHRTLNELVKSGEISKISGGRYTSYTWNRERE